MSIESTDAQEHRALLHKFRDLQNRYPKMHELYVDESLPYEEMRYRYEVVQYRINELKTEGLWRNFFAVAFLIMDHAAPHTS